MQQHLQQSAQGLSFLMLVAMAGCSSTPPPVQDEVPKVTVAHPEKRQLTDREQFTGWLAADKTIEVRSRVRGHIAKINFTDGQIVPAGKVLIELDPRPFDSDIKQAEAKQKIFEAQKVAAEKEEARLKELLTKGGASKSQVEKAEADTKSLVAQIGGSEEAVKRAQLELEYSQIKAEITGRIGAAKLDVGNLVNAGGSDPLLAKLVSIDPMRIYFNVDERSLRRYADNVGVKGKNLTELLAGLKDAKSPFKFALDGETDFKHDGTLAFADNQIDPTTGTLQLYGMLDNKGGNYQPGSRVRVRLTIGKPYDALLVPETAILADQDKRYVLISSGEKNIVQRRNVTLGALTDDGMRAITPADKLPDGEKPESWWVLVDNLQRARLNYPIDPQKPAAPASKASP